MAMRLLGPAATVRVRSEADYTARAARLAAAAAREVRTDPRPLVAYVSEGRWCADCPGCGAGIAIHPEWTVAACLGVGCHRVYRSIAVPPDWVAIEAALEGRDRRHQHARLGETALDLEAENALHRDDRGER